MPRQYYKSISRRFYSFLKLCWILSNFLHLRIFDIKLHGSSIVVVKRQHLCGAVLAWHILRAAKEAAWSYPGESSFRVSHLFYFLLFFFVFIDLSIAIHSVVHSPTSNHQKS